MSTVHDLATLAAHAVEAAGRAVPGADVEASIDRSRLGLTRFANSVIHQNVAEDVVTASVRLHHAGRTCASTATIVDERGLDELIARAAGSVAVAPHDPGWPGLAPAMNVDDTAAGPADDVEPAVRAEAVRAFVDGAAGLETAGFCRTSTWDGAFANSAGTVATGAATECGMSGIARAATIAGTADGVARFAPLRIDDIDGGILGRRAAAKALAWDDPIELPPGRYEIVLEPTAVADVVETLAISGFNGKAVNERRSFVRLGEAQLDPSITLVDDPLALGYRFDAEGTRRNRLILVDAGVTRAVAHDRRTAAEAHTDSTGHAGAVRFAFGPFARHLALVAPGGAETATPLDGEVDGPVADSSVANLVAGVGRGILVSDLWYTRLLDPRSLAVTGLTRNGVWLIENGEVTVPVRNLRFTQSYAQALMPGNVLGVGRVATPVPGDTYTARSPRWTCPALHLASWNFTGGASG